MLILICKLFYISGLHFIHVSHIHVQYSAHNVRYVPPSLILLFINSPSPVLSSHLCFHLLTCILFSCLSSLLFINSPSPHLYLHLLTYVLFSCLSSLLFINSPSPHLYLHLLTYVLFSCLSSLLSTLLALIFTFIS